MFIQYGRRDSMQPHLLTPGTLLDDRYCIQSVLGEGGFGITYAAENLRIGMRVAIKELFWRGYSSRHAKTSPQIEICSQQHAPAFESHKERFLREARIIRDFSSLPGVVHILDYFEANATAYIVMEYVEGETLAAYLSKHSRIPAEELFARFLPLAQSLGKIHACGVIHRDISPDNIMVHPDGSMTLIDFGAARGYRSAAEGSYTAIAKDSFAPSEQYDKNGNQGPWTDVYALCATLYACITGFPPHSAVQRMFLDELKKPSALGVPIEAAYENVIMKGLDMSASRRYGDMEALAAAMRAALPQPKPRGKARSALIGMIAGLLCAAVGIGLWLYNEDKSANKFRGIETETFWLFAPKDMTASAFAQVQTELAARLDAFAGADGYLLHVQGDQIRAEVPLDAFGGQEIYAVLKSEFMPLVDGKRYNMEYELKADWEDPTASIMPGKNQVNPDALTGKTAMLSYTWSDALTPGQRANLLMDFKVRLDALGVPYAFGALYGDENALAVRISPERLNPFVLDSLGSSYFTLGIAGDYRDNHIAFTRSSYSAKVQPVQYEDGSFGVSCLFNAYRQERLQALMQDLRSCGEETLYLQSENGYALAQCPIADVQSLSCVDFKTFRFEGMPTLYDDARWVVEYVDALVNQTELPAVCVLDESRMLDESGKPLLGESLWDHDGLILPQKACDAALRTQVAQFAKDQGADCLFGDSLIRIQLDLPVNDDLVAHFASAISSLLYDYGLADMVINDIVEIVGIREQSGESFLVWLDTAWGIDQPHWINDLDCQISTEGRLAPYADEFIAWWRSIDAQTWGVTAD